MTDTHGKTWWPGKNKNDDTVGIAVFGGKAVYKDLGAGSDTVVVLPSGKTDQIRLTFTSAEVGNGSAKDGNAMANQDGGLAVRLQAEDSAGKLVGPASRFDDEGIRFVTAGKATFDVRDLVSGVQRGDQFDVVQLGTKGNDWVDDGGEKQAYYINVGMGNDWVTGGRGNDFLVGGAGHDRLHGGRGNDSFIGGGGDDHVSGGSGHDLAIANLATDGADKVDLGHGMDTVNVGAPATAKQVRLTFTSAEVGDGSSRDSDTMANQDGGLAVRLQAEAGSGNLAGPVSRYDDEGVSFVSTTPGVTFDVRDLVSGTQRGDQLDVVSLGTKGNDHFDESGEDKAYYINAGMGNDRLTGGLGRDFLVGGAGNDWLNGREGNDAFIGGAGTDVFVFTGHPGHDSILDFVSGTDKIDLRTFDVGFDDVTTKMSGANSLVSVDKDDNGTADFQITLANSAAPVEGDFLFG